MEGCGVSPAPGDSAGGSAAAAADGAAAAAAAPAAATRAAAAAAGAGRGFAAGVFALEASEGRELRSFCLIFVFSLHANRIKDVSCLQQQSTSSNLLLQSFFNRPPS